MNSLGAKNDTKCRQPKSTRLEEYSFGKLVIEYVQKFSRLTLTTEISSKKFRLSLTLDDLPNFDAFLPDFQTIFAERILCKVIFIVNAILL